MRIEIFTQKAIVLFQYSAIAYLFVAIFYFMGLPTGGDEFLFLSDLQLIHNVGWYEAIAKNVSIPYMILAYPLSLLMEDFVALRIVNILLVVLLLVYFYYVKKIKLTSIYFYLFFFMSTVGYFYYGTNDCLFFVSLIIFFNEVHCVANDKEVHFNLALSALIIAFFTRELFLVYLPIVLIGCYILYQSGCRFTKRTVFPLGIFVVLLLLNIPSLQNNGSLSYDRKSPPEGLGVSWSQRQYLAQLMVNNGELANRQHPSWEATQQYLKTNGRESLPDGILNGLTYNYQLTIKEFFKDFAYSITYSLRSLGLMLFIILLYWFKGIKMDKKLKLNYFVPFATLSMLMIFSFIIISYVELRWLSAVFVMTIVYYSEIEDQNKISKHYILANAIVLCFLSLYGIFRILNKI
ncbi:hypothetical protein [Flavobacterium sp.]|uniref:hypothetical protein n=1 Tax=Flavobacterium sp. TaxID=239 RepID=UPI0025C352DC|nr:hypothetical protein [Flavobacterium sp.]MBA4277618.1 hypothetical protein [Flavobacterium sp.]